MMPEINVMGGILTSDELTNIQSVDLPNGKEKNLNILKNNFQLSTLLKSTNINENKVDILGEFRGETIGIETKGVTKPNQNNFKYWSKGITNQLRKIEDIKTPTYIGIGIPSEAEDTLRGVLSSFHSSILWR